MSKIYGPQDLIREPEQTFEKTNRSPEVHTKRYMTVKSARLNVRSNPSYSGLVLTILNRGEHVMIRTDDTERNGFVPVKTNDGKEGWIAKQYLE